ncbi:helix-turn-helix domain-containing protein [Peredibacter sp. HCB2-198]|uniref:helix-turn-helix domain-containing protein n=1 Tax=Peredibacter sp. HCB2-198 TaxID=3383025 RepID=UPI0038B60BBA
MKNEYRLIEALKKLLKSKGILYKDLARGLNLSEASVKRMFSSGDMSLSRLGEICHFLDIQITDLLKYLETERQTGSRELSLEQEAFLAKKPQRLAYLELMLGGMKPKMIEKKFGISHTETTRILLELDKWNFIELLPGDKVKFKVHQVIKLRENGPLRKLIQEKGIKSFLDAEFKGPLEQQEFATFKASEKTIKKFNVQLMELINGLLKDGELESISGIPTVDAGIFTATRPWGLTDLFGI